MLTFKDRLFLEQKGISEEKIDVQVNHFINGFPFLKIERPATVPDGIIRYGKEDIAQSVIEYDKAIGCGLKVTKFVPASGAATRMFKALFDALDVLDKDKTAPINNDAQIFFDNLPKFPFYNELETICGFDLHIPIDIPTQGAEVLRKFLFPTGMGYGNKPKGILKFHANNNIGITPVEEHLLEGALYCADINKHVHIHFTVSPEHESLFRKIVADKKHTYEERFGISYKIGFSEQKSSTDTIAVTPTNELFRQEDGNLVFRPAGHGALIENLNDLNSDLVFIKNIDNVVPEHLVSDTVTYKKALAGTLVKIRQKVFDTLHTLPQTNSDTEIFAMIEELETKFHLAVPQAIKSMGGESLRSSLHRFLNRPIRVCGMVKNEGEPGGGPFWVGDPQNNLSLQIVESSQIDPKDPKSKAVMQASTHFNPVDLVCGLKNHKGNKFDLPLYVDPDTGFISEKSLNGKALRALELPGLWNGAMAHWITIFAEVPLSTFNPVKTVNDLLRPQHQSDK
ncbi:MAG: DUF4301 family protein [Breznakibacter sp.]